MKHPITNASRKILSLIVAAAMIFSMFPVTAFAEAEPDDNIYATSGVTISGTEDGGEPDGEDENEPSADEETPESPASYSIVAFAALADSVAMQTVTVDATRADLILPESLNATVSEVEAETEESIGGVTWQSEPEFEAVTVGALELIPAGTYVFTPTLPQGYDLADGVALPVITVEALPMGIQAAAGSVEGIFKGKYGKDQIFDCFRSPSTPVAGTELTLTGFALPFDDSRSTDPSSSSTRIQFTNAELENRYFAFGDVGTGSYYEFGYPVSLSLYHNNGTLDHIVSTTGQIYALGKEGFVYISEKDFGYFISNGTGYSKGGSVTYIPTTGLVKNLEDLINYNASSEVVAAGNYLIIYDENYAGAGEPDTQTAQKDVSVNLQSAPTRDGYTFLGWATSSSATSAEYQAGASYTGNVSVTFYAVWEESGAAAQALTGTPTISNMSPRIGDTLTGSLVDGNNTGTLTYTWKAGGTQVGTGTTYTVLADDLGKTITLEITSDVETGTVTSAGTAAVAKKAAPPAPATPPTAGTVTDTTVTLVPDSTMQFSKDGTTWQDSNVFDNLAPNTDYTFYQRLKETDTHTASDASPVLTVKTEKAALTGKPTITTDGGGAINIDTQLGFDTSDLNDTSNLTYQWYRDGVAIDGATGDIYTVTGEDAGSTITVTVTAGADSGYEGSVTSDPTAIVPYTVIVENKATTADNESVTGQTAYKLANETVAITYTLKNVNNHIINELRLKYGADTNDYITVSTIGDAQTYTYTVSADHAVNGIITLTPGFYHASKLTTVGDSTVTAPEKGETPQTSIDELYYEGEITWVGELTEDGKFAGDTEYTAEVELTAKDGTTFDENFMPDVTDGTLGTVTVSPDGSTVTYTITYDATPAKVADSIAVDTQSLTTTYYAGDKLDVTGLVVTVTYDDGTTGTVTPDKYYIDGVEVVPGVTVLTTAQDGKTITVEYGGKTETVGTVTMYSPLSAQIYISDLADTSAKITYSANGGSGNIETKLQVKKSGVWTDVANTSTPQTYIISNLAPNTSYEFRVVVRDTDTGREYTKPVTFKTAQDSPSGITVEGDVTDNTNPTAIIVTLENGNTVISSMEATAKSGVADTYTFSFTNVPDGIYNLVVDNGSWKVTQAVTIVNGTIINPVNGIIEIDMASGRTQSVVEIVNADTPPASVGGLPELFQDNNIYTPADATLVSGGGTVEIKLAVEKIDSPTDANLIANAASGQEVGLYLDLSVIKSRIDSTGALLNETKLSDLNRNLITITFELPDGLKGKNNLTIYRVHGGIAQALPFAPKTNASGENADISGDIVTLNVCKFSTYAIAYTQTSPPNPPSPPTSPSSNGGSSSGGGGSSSPTPPTQWVDESDTKTLVKSATGQGADSIRTSSSGEAGIRKKALQTLGKSGLTYRHDTVADGAVRVRVYVDDPSAATKDILVSGYTSGANVDKTTAIINKWFSNDAAVLSFDQQGDFGMNVRIAALVNLSGLDTSKLYFYSYDKATNKYKLIVTEYRIDSKGYVHFSTVLAGSIIITDRPLTKIGADAEEDAYEPPMTGGGLDNPTTGGDGTGMYIPPAKAQPQDFTVADSIVEAVAADGVLKLESNIVPAAIAGNAAGNSGGVLKINLDAPNVLDAAQESGKPSVGMIAGIVIALFFAAMILWAVIPRKNDPLLSVEEYRKK